MGLRKTGCRGGIADGPPWPVVGRSRAGLLSFLADLNHFALRPASARAPCRATAVHARHFATAGARCSGSAQGTKPKSCLIRFLRLSVRIEAWTTASLSSSRPIHRRDRDRIRAGRRRSRRGPGPDDRRRLVHWRGSSRGFCCIRQPAMMRLSRAGGSRRRVRHRRSMGDPSRSCQPGAGNLLDRAGPGKPERSGRWGRFIAVLPGWTDRARMLPAFRRTAGEAAHPPAPSHPDRRNLIADSRPFPPRTTPGWLVGTSGTRRPLLPVPGRGRRPDRSQFGARR